MLQCIYAIAPDLTKREQAMQLGVLLLCLISACHRFVLHPQEDEQVFRSVSPPPPFPPGSCFVLWSAPPTQTRVKVCHPTPYTCEGGAMHRASVPEARAPSVLLSQEDDQVFWIPSVDGITQTNVCMTQCTPASVTKRPSSVCAAFTGGRPSILDAVNGIDKKHI